MTGQEIIQRYNSTLPGGRFEAFVDALTPGLRMWLLEAGARHTAAETASGWRLVIERRASPAQGAIPGLHHVVASGDSVWACERAQRVARFDAEGRCVAVRHVAQKASHLALGGERLFVADAGGDEVIALRADDLSELARWRAPGMPQLPLAAPEGIVVVTGSGTGTVTIAWPRNGRYQAKTIPVGAVPHDPCVDAAGEHVFVPCSGDGTVAKVRLADGEIVGRVRVGEGPSHLARHPDGSCLYSANSWDGTVSCLSAEGELLREVKSGAWAHAIDVAPDGRFVYVANFFDDTLAVFDAGTLERVALLPTEPYSHGLDVSPDGRHVISTGFCSNHARVFDAQSLAEIGRIEVGAGSSHTAFTSDGAAWIGCSVADHLAHVDLEKMQREGVVALTPD